jgi:hypothetical protein
MNSKTLNKVLGFFDSSRCLAVAFLRLSSVATVIRHKKGGGETMRRMAQLGVATRGMVPQLRGVKRDWPHAPASSVQ